ncbi:MAG: NAD-dependent epimerase/dehydratase family protein [Saprospiraceae bacterium]|nr:NAD-dependent epimerase/dehydratase family protein [Saprospiraceae bacterium]HPG07785.1 NAD-dependent epimerase/dehydratase family protein [Saprospiraceae bacterium]
MALRVFITGSTGMVGQAVLLECLESPDIERVLVINRRPLGIAHPKLEELIHSDLGNLDAFIPKLLGWDACFYCLGVSSAGMKEEAYTRITFDYTIHCADVCLKANPNMVFCYVSGAGTDSTEEGRSMWARVKGRTENALLAMPFQAVYLFRPGYIQPMKGIRSRTPGYNALYTIFKPFYPLLKHLPKWVTSTDQIGKAMIRVTLSGYKQPVLESIDINTL